ncbi:MAG: phenylalanine--tRNA ligase subunit beta [Pirellulales bacterium]
MLLSWSQLADYVSLDCSHEEFARRMMLAGMNHEESHAVGNDVCVDLEITSNRPDCLGQIGLAREAAVLWKTALKLPATAPKSGTTKTATLAKLTVAEPQLCPRYIARVIRGVKVGASPAWLVERLTTIGIAPVNNVVDITNYVLMECGQPLHAFDLKQLAGPEIVVRRAKKGETLQAINHKTYELTESMLVIADRDHPVALAGVMGGASTEVDATTTDLLIEAAEFDPSNVRATARALALHSDSSYRFERGLDPAGVDWASRRCCELILQLCGGEVAAEPLDVGASAAALSPVTLRFAQLERIIGIPYPTESVREILSALGLKETACDATSITVVPPSWRRDLTREIDLIEEVARVYGYDAIPEDRAVPLVPSARTRRDRVLGKLRTALVGCGFDEAMTLSAVDEAASAAFSPWTDAEPLRASTPVLRRADRLRRSLVPSLLQVRRNNEALSNPRIELFETAKVYWPSENALPVEETMLALSSGGDYFALKGVVEALVAALSPHTRVTCKPYKSELFAAGRGAEVFLGEERLGYLGEVSKKGLQKFELRGATTVAELRIDALDAIAELIPQAHDLSQFPPVSRDVNLIVDEAIRWEDVERTVLTHAGPQLERLTYLDTYRNPERLGAGKKSLLFSLLLRGQQETLTSAAADTVRDTVLAACNQAHGGILRA